MARWTTRRSTVASFSAATLSALLCALAALWSAEEEDFKRAKVWLERAVARGHRDGKVYLAALLAAAPSAEVRNPERALALLGDVFRKVDDDPESARAWGPVPRRCLRERRAAPLSVSCS